MQLEPDEVDADAEEFLNELNLLSDVPVVYPGTVMIVMLINGVTGVTAYFALRPLLRRRICSVILLGMGGS